MFRPLKRTQHDNPWVVRAIVGSAGD